MPTVPTRPDDDQSRPGFRQPLEPDDPRLPQFDQTPMETCMEALDVAALRREVAALRAELERRDVEQIAVENAIEFLHRQEKKHLYVLAELITVTVGRGPKYGGADMMARLYPNPIAPGIENCVGDSMVFERPARRWTQFGSRKDLLELAASNGVPLKSWEKRHRESLIRRLWRARVLPGSVALLDEKIARDERAAVTS